MPLAFITKISTSPLQSLLLTVCWEFDNDSSSFAKPRLRIPLDKTMLPPFMLTLPVGEVNDGICAESNCFLCHHVLDIC